MLIQCSHCHHLIDVPAAATGQQIQCGLCQRTTTIAPPQAVPISKSDQFDDIDVVQSDQPKKKPRKKNKDIEQLKDIGKGLLVLTMIIVFLVVFCSPGDNDSISPKNSSMIRTGEEEIEIYRAGPDINGIPVLGARIINADEAIHLVIKVEDDSFENWKGSVGKRFAISIIRSDIKWIEATNGKVSGLDLKKSQIRHLGNK